MIHTRSVKIKLNKWYQVQGAHIFRLLLKNTIKPWVRFNSLSLVIQPRPQGAFPWLWRWGPTSKAREKHPENEVACYSLYRTQFKVLLTRERTKRWDYNWVPQYHPLSLKSELQRGPKSCKMTSEHSVCRTSHSSKAYMQPRYIY